MKIYRFLHLNIYSVAVYVNSDIHPKEKLDKICRVCKFDYMRKKQVRKHTMCNNSDMLIPFHLITLKSVRLIVKA
jgi:hypothetical protein